MPLSRPILFIIPSLPRPTLSLRAIFKGEEAVSGTLGSTLLVLHELASRNQPVAALILGGQSLTDSPAPVFTNLTDALPFATQKNAVTLYTAWGERHDLSPFNRANIRPWIWLQI